MLTVDRTVISVEGVPASNHHVPTKFVLPQVARSPGPPPGGVSPDIGWTFRGGDKKPCFSKHTSGLLSISSINSPGVSSLRTSNSCTALLRL
ncbi:hypothetical protein BgiMline_012148 [Biomphalaria glabrata]|nr:hypothetical protein BgiMline_030716 [Biomphalaria glabrata]